MSTKCLPNRNEPSPAIIPPAPAQQPPAHQISLNNLNSPPPIPAHQPQQQFPLPAQQQPQQPTENVVRVFDELMKNIAKMKMYVKPSMCKPYGKQSEILQKSEL